MKIDRDPRTSSDYRKKCPFFRNPETGPTRAHCGRHFDFGVARSAMRVDNSICNKTSDVRFSITSTVLALFEENQKLFWVTSCPPILYNGILRFFKMAAEGALAHQFHGMQNDSVDTEEAHAEFEQKRSVNKRGVGRES